MLTAERSKAATAVSTLHEKSVPPRSVYCRPAKAFTRERDSAIDKDGNGLDRTVDDKRYEIDNNNGDDSGSSENDYEVRLRNKPICPQYISKCKTLFFF